MKATAPILGLLIVVLAGCATSESSKMASADVNGTWTGSLSGGARTYTLILKQTGTQVTGTIAGAGTIDGPIDGIVDGNTIRLRDESGYAQTPSLMVTGDRITGLFRGTTLDLRRVN
jgi:hypothetical protein